jgi:Arc/MetJ-type ribon-helix-helix transcriptional regulator
VRRRLYSFIIDPELRAGIRRVKVRDGISESEQIRRGIRLWLKQQHRYETDLVHVLRRRIAQLMGDVVPEKKREHENKNEDDYGDARKSHRVAGR